MTLVIALVLVAAAVSGIAVGSARRRRGARAHTASRPTNTAAHSSAEANHASIDDTYRGHTRFATPPRANDTATVMCSTVPAPHRATTTVAMASAT